MGSRTTRDERTWAILDVLGLHRYDYQAATSKPTNPGWNACICGWEGYWCDFNPHLAEAINAAL